MCVGVGEPESARLFRRFQDIRAFISGGDHNVFRAHARRERYNVSVFDDTLVVFLRVAAQRHYRQL